MNQLNMFSFLSCILFAIGFQSCQTQQASQAATTPALFVGIQNSPSNALVIIADEKKLFDTTKVKVTIQEFAAGKLALQALLGQANDLDVAVSAETPIVLSTLAGNKLKVIGQIVEAKNECRVVVRKDGNLNTPETYFSKKRKITTSQGGSPEWSTYNFIQKHKIKDKVEIIAMDPANMPATIANSSVEGISIFDPFARIAEKELGDKGITFVNEDLKSYYVMSVKEKTVTEKGEALAAYVAGLQKAAAFVKAEPQAAQAIIAQRTKLDAEIISSTWGNYNFTVTLSSELNALFVAEATWAIEVGKYPKETPMPNFSSILFDGFLAKK